MAWCEQRLAGGDDADRVDEAGRFDVLNRKPAAPARSAPKTLVELERFQHDDSRRGQMAVGAQKLGGAQPVGVRHPDVHECNIGAPAPRHLDRLRAVGRLADDADVRLVAALWLSGAADRRSSTGRRSNLLEVVGAPESGLHDQARAKTAECAAARRHSDGTMIHSAT